MTTKIDTRQKRDRFWLFFSLISLSILYLNLIWRTTTDLDRLTTDSLFWAVILWSLWYKRDRFSYDSGLISSFVGWFWLSIVMTKTITLFWFESTLLPILPFSAAIALAVIASGFKGLLQYWRELFFTAFLFFPVGAMGYFLDRQTDISLWTAKVATYLLYYFGFNVANQGNEVLLFLPNFGEFQATILYPCTGGPMILLMLKLALLLSILMPLEQTQRLFLPVISIVVGFILGVIRVCILTLAIPKPAEFDYWHGSEGSQIFSTLAVVIFSLFCYWIVQQRELKIET
ncbi:cyanoexosortase A [Myxosarcina sp. GI1]|uniref:cyanoexosortase A n=1 Tax=Myxosarcina sp. GI1 TaxID=1541065 RepID=UPI0012E013DE|nr:cyanoexosortase A [Myxosarcina sp. GI1]